MTCPLCEPIGPAMTANTGRDEYFGEPVTLMKWLELGNDHDFRVCPTCGDFFVYTSYQAQTGSGNNDEDTITRMPPEASAALRVVLDGGASDLGHLAARLVTLPPVAHRLGAALLFRNEAVFSMLVPHLLDVVVHGEPGPAAWAADLVHRFAALIDAAAVKLELAKRDNVALAPLRAQVAVAGCSICRSIKPWPPTRGALGALPLPLAALTKFDISPTNDLWRCPECESLFRWDTGDGGAVRVHDNLVPALREVLRGGTVPKQALELLVSYGRAWHQLLEGYAMKYDRELLQQLQPLLTKQ